MLDAGHRYLVSINAHIITVRIQHTHTPQHTTKQPSLNIIYLRSNGNVVTKLRSVHVRLMCETTQHSEQLLQRVVTQLKEV